ncbi:MAG: endonuclease III domain-containing protein [Candidatus Woesearchaeota archaeon]
MSYNKISAHVKKFKENNFLNFINHQIRMNELEQIFLILLENYGYQGWFPLIEYNGTNPTKTGSIRGYHPGNYELPKTLDQVYEISIGAILTQNTSWTNVEKALLNLYQNKKLNYVEIHKIDIEKLKELIKPAGFYNQKAERLKLFTTFFIQNLNRIDSIEREELLSLKGIGKETADTILLYALKKPFFVVDKYTQRFMARLGFEFSNYEELQNIFQNSLEKDYRIYNEYHALIVEHAKRYCKKNPNCESCPLNKICKRKIL